VCCTSGSITGHRDSRVQCIALMGALEVTGTVGFSVFHLRVHCLQIRSDSRVQCVALLGALEVTGTVGFIVLHLRVHCLHYRSEVTVGFSVLHL